MPIFARAQYGLRKENYFAVQPQVVEFGAGPVFDDGTLKVTAVAVDHVDEDVMPCFGMRFDGGGKSVVFSSDTAPTDSVVELARGADLLIHECAMSDEAIDHRKKTKVGIVKHTTPVWLGEVAARADVKSLLAIHQGGRETTNPVLLALTKNHLPEGLQGPGYFDHSVTGIRKNYAGPLRIARDLMRIDL